MAPTASARIVLLLTVLTASVQTVLPLTVLTASVQTVLPLTAPTALVQTALPLTVLTASVRTALPQTALTALVQTALQLTAPTALVQTVWDNFYPCYFPARLSPGLIHLLKKNFAHLINRQPATLWHCEDSTRELNVLPTVLFHLLYT
jgi:preprotein translocase subunit SecY